VEPASVSRDRRWVLLAVLALLGVPVVVAAAGAASFYVSNRGNRTMVSAGHRREYLLHVPRTYDPARPAPLVISLHGAGLWGAAQEEISRWNRLADVHGFLVVYPSGARGSGPRTWGVRDIPFIAELIDTLKAAYHIDSTRIYADGLSNGGGMSFALSCTLSDRIAAVGLVASAQLLPWTWCRDRRPVPMIAFHGTADPMVPYHGGGSLILVHQERFPDLPAFVATWARRNRCADRPVESAVAADVRRREYLHCAGDASVVLYTVLGGGHTWPGGKPLPESWMGPTTTSVDATGLMWAFYSAHPLTGMP
jgi:polyhydroxybutyrate depolymerase